MWCLLWRAGGWPGQATGAAAQLLLLLLLLLFQGGLPLLLLRVLLLLPVGHAGRFPVQRRSSESPLSSPSEHQPACSVLLCLPCERGRWACSSGRRGRARQLSALLAAWACRLNLVDCQNTLIGTAMSRGISGARTVLSCLGR